MTISTVGTLVNSSVTTGQATVPLTTVNVGDLVVVDVVIFGNITINAVTGGNTSWGSTFGPGYNATLNVTAVQMIGVTTAAGAANITLTFSASIGTTKVQRTITQLTAGLGAGTHWYWDFGSQANAASTTLTYPTGMLATPLGLGYPPSAPTGPFAYVGYGIGGATGSAGATAGFSYTVDANSGVLAVNTAVTQGTIPAPTASLASSTVSVALGALIMAVLPGAAILTPVATGVRLAVEAAFGADLTDLTGSSWTWFELSSDVLMSDKEASSGDIQITVGRSDESTTCNPGVMTCTLDNRSGNYSQGGGSLYWPYIRRGTPVRVRVSTDSGATWNVKYQGRAVSWSPAWDAAGRFATVVLTASGMLRQINQGTLPPQSYYAQAIPTLTGSGQLFQGLQYYWNNEGGNGFEGSDGISNCYPTIPSGIITPSDNRVLKPVTVYIPHSAARQNSAAFPISGPIPANWDFSSGTPLPATPNTGQLTIRWLCAFSSLSGTQTQPLIYWRTSANTSLLWAIMWDNTGGLRVQNGTDATASNGFLPGMVAFNANGQAWYMNLQMSTSGSSSAIRLDVMSYDGTATGFSWTATGSTTGYLYYVNFIGPGDNDASPVSEAHMTIQNVLQGTSTAMGTFFKGNPGESVTARLTRILNNADYPITHYTSATGETSTNPADSCGGQYYDTLTNLVREVEATGQGLLFDGLDIGLSYVTRQRRASQQPTLTLDASAGELTGSIDPVDDDQFTFNQATVNRRNGMTVTWTDTASDLSANAVGVFSNSVQINPVDDSALYNWAQWLVHLGTLPGYRFPHVSFALDSKPSKIAAWLGMIPSGRLDITNITALRAVLPQGTIRLIVEGWTETINAYTWRVTANCTPWAGWNVGTMAASTGTTVDTVMRRDTDGSATNTSYAAGTTSVQVKLTAAGKPLWTTAADDFPLLAEIGGNCVTVTGISGASSPQTFTLASPGLPFAVAANAVVRLWNPPVLGL